MALVLLHAIGLDAGSWKFAAIPNSAPLDLPGFGDEPLPLDGLHLSGMAEDILRRAPAGPLDVVGVSMGSQVAMQLGLRHRARVRSLVLANSGPAADPATMKQRAASVAAEGVEAHAEANIARWFTEAARTNGHPAIDYVRSRLRRDTPESLRAGWFAISEHNVKDRLRELTMPVTVIAARDDAAAPVAVLEAMSTTMPNSRLAVVAGPHLAYMESPAEFRAAVVAHLAWVAHQTKP